MKIRNTGFTIVPVVLGVLAAGQLVCPAAVVELGLTEARNDASSPTAAPWQAPRAARAGVAPASSRTAPGWIRNLNRTLEPADTATRETPPAAGGAAGQGSASSSGGAGAEGALTFSVAPASSGAPGRRVNHSRSRDEMIFSAHTARGAHGRGRDAGENGGTVFTAQDLPSAPSSGVPAGAGLPGDGTPVPEPATVLAGGALLAILAFRERSRLRQLLPRRQRA